MSDLTLFEGQALTNLEKASSYLCKSSLVPSSYRGKQAETFSALILGHSLGLNPMQSLLEIHVIQGRPAMSTKLMFAVVKRMYPEVKTKFVKGDDTVTLHFKLTPNDETYTTTWNEHRAIKLNLMGRDQYKKQLVTMLSWRCLSEAIRFCAPDAVLGLYSIDEAYDLNDNQNTDDQRMYENDKDPEEMEIGHPEYIFPYRKFRGKKLKDIPKEELETRYDYIEVKTKKPNYVIDQKDADEMATISIFLESQE